MSASLAEFQRDFAQALFAPAGQAGALAAQPAFAIYRNTVMKGCIDALEANYPAVARLVGSEWFRAAAALYVAEAPPHDSRLLHYGAGFADFLGAFEPARELPYLAAVARLDRCWTEAHCAADASPADGTGLAALAPEALGAMVLAPHPSARWHWFADQPIYTIWSRNRAASFDDSEIAWQGEGALLTRPEAAVIWCAAGEADCAFLDACARSETLGSAAAAALAVDPQADLADLLARLLGAGAFRVPANRMSESTP